MVSRSARNDRLPTYGNASRWIVGSVAFCSIAVFGWLGSSVIPTSLTNLPGSKDRASSVAFLLTIALVLLAWRRAADLKKSALARTAAEERAHYLAYKDEVTGLFNRRFLSEKLKSHNGQNPLTFLLLDVDHFKKINDLYGHTAGDQLLTILASRMQSIGQADACCVRLGGDEFGVLLEDNQAALDQATAIAAAMLDGLNRPASLDGTVAHVGVSIGISTLEPGDHAEVLLHRSDIAMYHAKRGGRNCYIWFDALMEQELNERNVLEAQIRDGIIEGRFIPYFQPSLDLASEEVTGFEVLARWDHPTKGIVEPEEFIPVAEATGLISDLSLAVMRTALQQSVHWPHHITIAVNVSPVQFKDPLLSQRIIKVLTETGFPAARLELEITEGSILDDRALALSTVESLKNYGVRIALDDFGTGYASLSQLRELPFDRIKIDKSFVASLLNDKQSNAIVHAIATLGRSLNLPITAEGVEAENVHLRLRELGCSDAQGWLWGKAVPAAEAALAFAMTIEGSESNADDQIESKDHARRRQTRKAQKPSAARDVC